MRWRAALCYTIPCAFSLMHALAHASGHAARADVEVDVHTFAFSPDTIAVRAGTRIRWTNHDAIEHTITWGTPDESDMRLVSGSLDSAGATHTATPREPGRYRYFCDRHRFMRGMLIVTSPGDRTHD